MSLSRWPCIVIGLMFGVACLSSVRAADMFGQRLQDEIYLVSARQIGCLRTGEKPQLTVRRHDAEQGWVHADMDDLVRMRSPNQILSVFVHGNRVSNDRARSQGRYVYRLITAENEDPGSVRFVIWSWPSEQIRGQLRDVRVKAQRTEVGGYALAWFLSQFDEHQRVSLLSYSFGARIVSGALHLLGGGQLGSLALSDESGRHPQARVVMMAAALHSTWLRPGCYHERTLTQTDYLVNLYNSCDPVLKRYPFLYKNAHPQALGFVGMFTNDLGDSRRKIEQHNVSSSVGKSHSIYDYLHHCHYIGRMRQVLSWCPCE